MFPVRVECNVISFLHPRTYVSSLQRFRSCITHPCPLPYLRPCFAIACRCRCINWAGGCPSHSSARNQASNSTLACSPAEHVMKWPNSADSPREGVGKGFSAVRRNASCDGGEPGGDPHLFPHAAHESGACVLASSGRGFCTSCRRVQDSHVCPTARKSRLAVTSVQDRLLRPAVLALI